MSQSNKLTALSPANLHHSSSNSHVQCAIYKTTALGGICRSHQACYKYSHF